MHTDVQQIRMTRTYTLKRRAEQQAETRRRIVEAAVELHSSVGPALTTLSQVAERAGVQRHTLYAHFPDEWSLFLACSGLSWLGSVRFREYNPFPPLRSTCVCATSLSARMKKIGFLSFGHWTIPSLAN